MSLVEKLAAKRLEWEGASLPYHPGYEEARFWLNAIAEELEEREAVQRERYEWPADSIRWLREQAKP